MKKASHKDILRTISHGKKRFVSIAVITALGVVMLAGLRAACVDLRLSADAFYDEQDLYDISIQSTLGLTDDDVEALAELEGVELAEGAYSETVYLTGETHESVLIKTLSTCGMNEPYIIEGELPAAADEIAVTVGYLTESGKSIGDTVTIEEVLEEAEDEDDEDEEPTFEITEYTITASVTDPANINNPDSATAFRDTSTTDYTFFVTLDAVNSDVYTAVYLTVSGAAELNSYSDDYDEAISAVVDSIEEILKTEREEARTQEVLDEAQSEIDEAEEEMNEAFEEAEEELADAQEELDDAREELDEGWEEYYDGLAEIEDAQAELDEGRETLEKEEEEALEQIADAKEELEEGREELESSWAELEENEATVSENLAQVTSALEEIEAGITQLEEGIAQLEAAIAQLSAYSPESEELTALNSEYEAAQAQLAELTAQKAELEESLAQLTAAQEELAEGRAQLEAAEAELEAGEEELETQEAEAKAEIAEAWEELEEGQAELDEAKEELEDGLAELEEGEEEYADGLAEYEDGKAEYEEEKADALAELEEAKEELADIDGATWYIQDRTSLSGFVNIDSDSGAIESIGTFFPIIFLAVAILISLTTVTRMVEEERGCIGTYKALGYRSSEILRKYMIYSLSACLCGCIVGEIGGFIVLPEIVFIIFSVMYSLPSYSLSFDVLYGLMGPVIFFAGIGIATRLACRLVLRQKPAALMRPKAPKAGSKVFLERFKPFWKRISFLNKVTIRNLFRYKKRLLMTVIGIMGCTSILMCGFAIKDSVTELSTLQYDDVYQYDLMATATDNDELIEYLDGSEEIENYISLRIDSVTLSYNGSSENIQIYVIPDDQVQEFGNYINLTTKDGSAVTLDSTGIFVTINAGIVLGFEAGDTVSIKDLTLTQAEAEVSAVVMNYMGNNVYMTQSLYESLFGEYEANGVLADFNDSCTDHAAWAKELKHQEGVTSATATAQLQDEFSDAFVLINMVVYVLLIMAAALAFVVLFTLSTTNISEREREIATIKVLGFHRNEVHTYVNKETIILTIIGIIPGLFLGTLLGHALTSVLDMPSLYFAVNIHPVSYLISFVLSLVFAFIVQIITNRTLNSIDPVEALKSIE